MYISCIIQLLTEYQTPTACSSTLLSSYYCKMGKIKKTLKIFKYSNERKHLYLVLTCWYNVCALQMV